MKRNQLLGRPLTFGDKEQIEFLRVLNSVELVEILEEEFEDDEYCDHLVYAECPQCGKEHVFFVDTDGRSEDPYSYGSMCKCGMMIHATETSEEEDPDFEYYKISYSTWL